MPQGYVVTSWATSITPGWWHSGDRFGRHHRGAVVDVAVADGFDELGVVALVLKGVGRSESWKAQRHRLQIAVLPEGLEHRGLSLAASPPHGEPGTASPPPPRS